MCPRCRRPATSRGWAGSSRSPGFDEPHFGLTELVLEGSNKSTNRRLLTVPDRDGLSGVAGQPCIPTSQCPPRRLFARGLLLLEQDRRCCARQQLGEPLTACWRPDFVHAREGEHSDVR